MKKYLAVLLVAGGFLLFARAHALSARDSELRMYVGEVQIIQVNNPTRVMIGNPNVIDVSNVGRKEMTVSAKAPGKTTLVYWDTLGEQSLNIKVLAEDLDAIKARVDNLIATLGYQEVVSQAEEEEGKVYLLGRLKTSAERERLLSGLGSLKDKVNDLIVVLEESAVVEIDVQVLELNKDASKSLGFTWPSAINLLEQGSPGLNDSGTKFSTLFKVLNLQRGTVDGADPFTFKLSALVQEGKARILSRPKLSCQSGKEAEMLVGGEKPVFSSSVVSGGGTSTSVSYKEYGIRLNIKPTVTAKEQIKVGLKVEVSEVGTAETIGAENAPSAKAYPLLKRTASTELFLDNGQTLAIGGLIKQKTETDVRKVAGLGDIPVLGMFFRNKSYKEGGGQGERGDSELFITLTPTIVSRDMGVAPVIKHVEAPSAGKVIDLEAEKPSAETPVRVEKAPDPLDHYARVVKERIMSSLTYPEVAKSAGFQGTVKLSLKLTYTGQLLEAVLKKSSGYQVLDDHALSVAKTIAYYPPFPPSIGLQEIWIDVPIGYHLE
ncbi:MAG: TonB family protein [Candidatus Omnitrophota bacterium]|jgi:pilus assembly protein CpaC